jgi:hypothetical protein
MRIGQHLAGILAGAAGNARIPHQAHNFVLAVLARPRLDDGVEFCPIIPARFHGEAEPTATITATSTWLFCSFLNLGSTSL